jgi:molybdenum cofactor cytidylyltransferase
MKCTAIVLAAGRGQRMLGHGPKPLLPINGMPMLVRSLQAYLGSTVTDIVVVLGYAAKQVVNALPDDPRIRHLEHSDWALGLGSSIAFAMRNLSTSDHVLLGLGDMPWVLASTVESLLQQPAHFSLVAPSHEGTRGHPVRFGPRWISDLAALSGDAGAAALLKRHRQDLTLCPVPDSGILRDVDCFDDLQ